MSRRTYNCRQAVAIRTGGPMQRGWNLVDFGGEAGTGREEMSIAEADEFADMCLDVGMDVIRLYGYDFNGQNRWTPVHSDLKQTHQHTHDGVRLYDGMAVWDHDLELGRVELPVLWKGRESWAKSVSNPNWDGWMNIVFPGTGRGYKTMDGDRLNTWIPLHNGHGGKAADIAGVMTPAFPWFD